jgi:integrase
MRPVVRQGYIEKRRRLYYAVLDIPTDVRDLIGGKRRFVQSLKTDDLNLAELRKRPIVAGWRRQIDEARRSISDPLMSQAIELRHMAETAFHIRRDDETEEEAAEFAEEMRSDEIVRHAERIETTHGLEIAKAFVRVARGEDNAIQSLLERWQSEGLVKPKERANREGVLRNFSEWLKRSQTPPLVSNITRKIAGRYVSDALIGRNRATAGKYLTCLSSFWRWLISKGETEDNPWRGHQLPRSDRGDDEKERAFTDDEVQRLLSGPADQTMREMMLTLALTGARVEEIASLRVSDVHGDRLHIPKTKTNAGRRWIPVHSRLGKLIAARLKNKRSDERVFSDVVSASKLGTHSAAFVKRFGYYRASIGIADKRDGIRRSLINLHSFRRWFITKAEQADINPWVIAAVVGHARPGMTLGVYSRGPSDDQLRKCVEAVRLSKGK